MSREDDAGVRLMTVAGQNFHISHLNSCNYSCYEYQRRQRTLTLHQHAYVHASCMPASSMRSLLIGVLAAPGAAAQAAEHQLCHQN